MLHRNTWSILVALCAGFCGSAVYQTLTARAPVHVDHHCHIAVPAPHGTPTPVQPVPALALDSQAAVLSMNQRTVAPGQKVAVAATVVIPLSHDAWIGIIPSHVPHGDESVNDRHDVAYQYLEGQAQRVFVFEAPGTPGRYDFRLHSTDVGGFELASIAFEVTGY